MKPRGQKYSFLGTAAAIVVIILFVIFQKYVFKSEKPQREETLPTQGTLAISTIEAQISASE